MEGRFKPLTATRDGDELSRRKRNFTRSAERTVLLEGQERRNLTMS